MSQLSLFSDKTIHKAPNVASVPQYSPLRYPGGKTWLYPYARKWLARCQFDMLIEPFAGGASVGLASAIEGWVEKVILVEMDSDVVALWQTIFNGNGEWLANKISNFEFNEKNIETAFDRRERSNQDRAFALILNNRINRGGIMANGAGRIKTGENGKGIKSRWYPDTLAHRILKIARHRAKFQIIEGDAFEVIDQFRLKSNAAFFIDPPYTIAGKRLYNHSEINHELLFDVMENVSGDFLMTYDDVEEVRAFSLEHNLKFDRVLMKTTHHVKKYELLIGRKLDWL